MRDAYTDGRTPEPEWLRKATRIESDWAEVLKPSVVDGKTASLLEHAIRRMRNDVNDGLAGTDHSSSPVSGTREPPLGPPGYGKPDPSHDDRERLRRAVMDASEATRLMWLLLAISDAEKGSQEVWRIVQRHAPRVPNDLEKQRTSDANEPLCEHCMRFGFKSDAKSIVEVWVAGASIFDGKHRLCPWCSTFGRRQKRPPTKEELTVHHRGGTVRVPAEEVA